MYMYMYTGLHNDTQYLDMYVLSDPERLFLFFTSSFADEPKMMEDLINVHTLQGHTLISISVGR